MTGDDVRACTDLLHGRKQHCQREQMMLTWNKDTDPTGTQGSNTIGQRRPVHHENDEGEPRTLLAH